jgi:HSP20 family protein
MALPTRVNRGMGGDPWDAIHREFDGLLNRVMGGQPENAGRWAPYGVDVREDGDHLIVEAELPGFRKEEVDLTLENQTLTISAERKVRSEQQKGEYLLNERRYNRFQRSFTLPPSIDDRSCDARLEDGILTITLNKREESKPRKIQVS